MPSATGSATSARIRWWYLRSNHMYVARMPNANASENSYMFANGPWPVAKARKTRPARSAKVASQPSIVA